MLCAIYCRLSKEDEEKQAESESIQNQKSMLIQYAVERGWNIVDLYCDEDYSGADRQRPDFNRMLADAAAQRFDLILCKTQSRFTRDMELVEKYIHGLLPLWGVRFVAVADNVDTDVKGNKKARQINGLINEWYLEDLSENIRMVFDHKRRQGQYIGGVPLYGYQKDPCDKNKLVVDPEAATVVRRIFQWYLEGQGKQHIACLLNEQGIANPTCYKREKGWHCAKGSAGNERGLWNKTTVGRILSNEMYTGVMVQGRRRKISYKSKALADVPAEAWFRVEGTHEPIIAPEFFQKARELKQPRIKSDGRGEVHALAGLVRCMNCGGTMIKTSNGQVEADGRRRAYLRCKLSAIGGQPPLCTRHSIRLDRLLEVVTERLRVHIGASYEIGDIARFAPSTQRDRHEAELNRELHSLEAQIGKRVSAIKALYLDKVAGVLEEAQFFDMNQDFLEEKRRMECRKQEIQSKLNHLANESAGGMAGLAARIDALLKQDPLPRELFVLTIACIEVGERDRETGRQAIQIQWKF